MADARNKKNLRPEERSGFRSLRMRTFGLWLSVLSRNLSGDNRLQRFVYKLKHERELFSISHHPAEGDGTFSASCFFRSAFSNDWLKKEK